LTPSYFILRGQQVRYIVFILFALLTGCGSVPKEKSSTDQASVLPEQRLFLDSSDRQAARLNLFLQGHSRYTEREKIDYLLNSIRCSDSTFVRNGEPYDSDQAAQWFRWKKGHRKYRNNPIRSADDFVERVAGHSDQTGLPYEVVLADGRCEELHTVLRNELDVLNRAVQEKTMERVIPRNSRRLPNEQVSPSPNILLTKTT